MKDFLIRRLILAIPTVIGVTMLVFIVMRIAPGDVAMMIVTGGGGEDAAALNQKELARIRAELGLDRPLHIQYLDWVWGMARLDFGRSLWNHLPIWDTVVQRAPLSVQLSLMSIAFAVLIGIPVGVVAALRQDTLWDYLGRSVSIGALAMPGFWLALLLLMVLVHGFEWSPPLGYNPIWQRPLDNLSQFIWPSLITGFSGSAIIARMARSATLEVMREDYVRTARAKGLAESIVVIRHVLRNAMIPVVTIVSLSLAGVITGSVIMETIFTIPGLGLLLIDSLRLRDFPVVMFLVTIVAMSFIVVNLLTDILYTVVDPRMRLQ
ncbi:MAG: ABC transporter permease [Chloroflexi bacterium]|nr:ABC transporter permease [Chloroflexota bacterium]